MKRGHSMTILLAVVAALLVLVGAGPSDRQAASGVNTRTSAKAPDYDLNWYSVNNGGKIATSSPSYELGLSVGQPTAGKTNSASFELGIGFWYGGVLEETCDCGVWGDVNDDGEINPVDVVYMVNFVYKNDDRRIQPPDCPYEAGDVNCDDEVNPIDVVRYVNYVYKNITPWPCGDPCDP